MVNHADKKVALGFIIPNEELKRDHQVWVCTDPTQIYNT